MGGHRQVIVDMSGGVKSIGHYYIGKTIGEGTFGKVKLGTHSLTGEKVAIKILEKERIKDAADVERVAREIHILQLIRHPDIIQLYEIIETPKLLYLIMEYASGGELFDYIVAHTRVEETVACRFFQQIVAGIEYIGKLGIVHRDLKPENLLLDHEKCIKIVDFGLGNTYKSGEKLKTACGSPCYAAPEMIAGKEYNGVEVDIWSCGIILFALVNGYLPFEDPNTSELYKKILSETPKCGEFVSEECQDLILRILAKNPEERYTIDDIRSHPWYRQVSQQINPGIIVGLHRMSWDTEVLRYCEELGFSEEITSGSLEANKHNQATTSYYLLLKKKIREGGRLVTHNTALDRTAPSQSHAQSEPLVFDPHPPVPKLVLDETVRVFRPRHRRVMEPVKRTGSTGAPGGQDLSMLSAKARRKVSVPDARYWQVDTKPVKGNRKVAGHSVSPGRARVETVKRTPTPRVIPAKTASARSRPPAGRSSSVDRSFDSALLSRKRDSADQPSTPTLSLQSHISYKPVEELMMIILNELSRQGVKYKPMNGVKSFALRCQMPMIKFELTLPKQDVGHVCCVRLMFGEQAVFQAAAEALLGSLTL